MNPRQLFLGALLACVPGCAEHSDDLDAEPTAGTADSLSARPSRGRELFENPLPGSNGRSCATCHGLKDHTALSIENVEARLAANPGDPLFHPLDADDPGAAHLTFDHLRKGLVRVVLPLPANMDVIDLNGAVVTAPDRTISVWRSVPTIENTAMTGPYQLDGRAANLSVQAQGAITGHSQGPNVAEATLDQIAAFERAQFSSPRAGVVAALLELGVPREHIPIPEQSMALSAQERRGRAVYQLACAHCHGGATTNQVVNRGVHDALFFALDTSGNIIFDVAPGQPPSPRLVPHASEFLNIGIGLLSGYGQMGQIPMFNDTVELPRYRFRVASR